jgi:hypothetical protein
MHTAPAPPNRAHAWQHIANDASPRQLATGVTALQWMHHEQIIDARDASPLGGGDRARDVGIGTLL